MASGDAAAAPLKNGTHEPEKVACSEMTSKDYYFDSYAHFGIHEVRAAHGTLLRWL